MGVLMPTGIYDRTKSKPNAGMFQKGGHYGIATEFRKGQHASPSTEFGNKPPLSFEERNCNTPRWIKAQSLSHKGQHSSSLTEIKYGQHLSPSTEFKPLVPGGVSTKELLIRASGAYVTWRKAVFGRDNYTCQKCGQRGGILEAHHYKSFAQYPELRLELSNGITLCKSCHRSGVMPNAEDDRPQKAV